MKVTHAGIPYGKKNLPLKTAYGQEGPALTHSVLKYGAL